jgi:hypothetical protein
MSWFSRRKPRAFSLEDHVEFLREEVNWLESDLTKDQMDLQDDQYELEKRIEKLEQALAKAGFRDFQDDPFQKPFKPYSGDRKDASIAVQSLVEAVTEARPTQIETEWDPAESWETKPKDFDVKVNGEFIWQWDKDKSVYVKQEASDAVPA